MVNKVRNGTNTALTPKQRRVAEKLADPEFSGTVTALCQACGVPRTTFYRWMADPTFLQYLEGLIERYTDGALGEVWKALVRECKRGSVPAMRLFFELKGRFKGEREAPPDKPVIIDDIGSQ